MLQTPCSLDEDEVEEALTIVESVLLSVLLAIPWRRSALALILLHFEKLHLDACLNHAEKVLAEVEEDHGSALNELQINHVVGVELLHFAWVSTITRPSRPYRQARAMPCCIS